MKKLLYLLLLSSNSFAGLTVHEWGTFTSVMGADGEKVEGLHLEEEALPSFVYNLAAPKNPVPISRPVTRRPIYRKGLDTEIIDDFNSIAADVLPINPIDRGVTQKMETPVIYFYGEAGTKVKVGIDFPDGLISQWFPDATIFTPTRSNISGLGPSHFDFNVTLMGKSGAYSIPFVNEANIWNPSREVNSNVIKNDKGEFEKFIFYRGVADFDAHFKVTSKNNDITVHNLSNEKIPEVFLFKTDGVKGTIVSLGSLEGGATTTRFEKSLWNLQDNFLSKAKDHIAAALVKEGLYADEARALVNTWEKSYFKTPGLRVLYILPYGETSRILPLSFEVNGMTSKVDLVRTLVGRVEILLDEEERNIIKDLKTDYLKRGYVYDQFFKSAFGRFALPKAIRIKNLIKEELGETSSIYLGINSLIVNKKLNN